jgi:hypothetical protein
MQLITGHWVSQAVYVATKFGIPDLLVHGPVAAEDLARMTRTDADALYRLLRALASIGVFSETSPRTFSLTPLASLLRRDTPGSLRALALIFNEVQYRSWGEMLQTIRTGAPAFERSRHARL